MLCLRCLRAAEGAKCESCECKTRLRGVTVSEPREAAGAGDRALRWRCAQCHRAVSTQTFDKTSSREQELLFAIKAIAEKFELVNKIQLPKLNEEISQIKNLTESIVKQNEDIMKRIDSSEKRKCGGACNCSRCWNRGVNGLGAPNRGAELGGSCAPGVRCYRRRSVPLAAPRGDQAPMLPPAEAPPRYRTRRRPLLIKVIHLLNRRSQRMKL